MAFALVVGALAAAKHVQNARQIAHAQSAPQRALAHFDRAAKFRAAYAPALRELVGAPAHQVRARIDPDGRGGAGGYPGWSPRGDAWPAQGVNFRDASSGCWIEMRFFHGRLSGAWTRSPPFVDRPVALWAASERLRRTAGVVGALLWLVGVVGAYAEPLLRARMARWALAMAIVALAAWSVEPPHGVRDRGLRVPYGPAVAGLFILLTLPALALAGRPARRGEVCPTCAYDLTGNRSGICPECGQPTPAEVARRRRERAAEFASALEEAASRGAASVPGHAGT